MRVGLLAYGLDRPLTGVTRLALELGRALERQEGVELTYLVPYRRGPLVGEPGVRTAYLPGCRLLPGLMVLGGPLIALTARRLGLDVVHDPIGVSPFTLGRWAGRFRRAVTIHDAIAFAFPEGYPWLNNVLHRQYVPATLGNVDAIATVSEHARGELARHLRIDPGRMRVIPHGVSPAFRPAWPERARAVMARYGLEEPFVLFVGALQARKNVLRLIDAVVAARKEVPRLRLALAGPSPWRYAEVRARLERSDAAAAVAPLGYVPEEELTALYGAASAFVFPSLYEGFGMPVLEAMASGAPVICSDATSLPEVAGGAALMVDARDAGAMAEAIARVVRDETLREELRAKGLERAAAFSWETSARAYVELYRG